MSFPKTVNEMGSFGEKRKKMFFRFCRPILDIFGFPLLNRKVGKSISFHMKRKNDRGKENIKTWSV